MQSRVAALNNPPSLLYSLKSRVIVILLLNTIIPVLLIGCLSYYSLISIFDNKIHNSIQKSLQQVSFALENELNVLNQAAMQLSFEQGIGKQFDRYLSSTDMYEKSQIERDIQNYIDLMIYTNPNVGLTYYYFSDTGKTAFKEVGIRAEFNPEQLRQLTSFSRINYHVPHRTMNPSSDALVLSVDKKILLPGYDNLHVYVETNLSMLNNIISSNNTGMNENHLMIDDEDRIVYSENERAFPIGSTFLQTHSGKMANNNHYVFVQNTKQDWKAAIVILEASYEMEKNAWVMRYAVMIVLSVGAALFLAWLLWKSLYRPLSGINKEIRSLQNSDFHSPLHYPHIAEFDFLLDRFQQMRERIWELIVEAEENEKKKAKLEVEKLLFQINPHFIHNTLDTIRWEARLHGHKELDRMISMLNKVLYYNMGKGGTATIRQEIEILKDYVTLQQIRYDFEFDVRIEADDKLLEVAIPRFLLQPLVENALYHGLNDNGRIQVKAAYDDSRRFIRIEVSDNGAGMEEEDLRRLVTGESAERRKSGMGIGIRYVSRMIDMQYGGRAKLEVHSTVGKGTSMVLYVPIEEDI
ncbi:sensor histidine kinase [Paenibacillus sp. HJGM_3]|uniref:sensor histidine kinase n=1 Tax=Paenibacillus sp. HJGM_3 TaxID=3379816 RepID=UPI00385D3AF5